jgi:hypothetical protein
VRLISSSSQSFHPPNPLLFLSIPYFNDFTVIYAFNLKKLEASFPIQRVESLDFGIGGGSNPEIATSYKNPLTQSAHLLKIAPYDSAQSSPHASPSNGLDYSAMDASPAYLYPPFAPCILPMYYLNEKPHDKYPHHTDSPPSPVKPSPPN